MKAILLHCALFIGFCSAAVPVMDPPCLLVTGKWLTASQLTQLLPAFGSIDPSLKVLAAPRPFARRFVSPEAATLLAQKLGAGAPESPMGFCVELLTVEITQNQVIAAMEKALPVGGPSLELINYYPKRSPQGTLLFSTNGMRPACVNGGCATVRWRGMMQWSEAESFPITAEVRISIAEKVPIAVRNLPTGVKIRADDFRWLERKSDWRPDSPAFKDDLVGQVVRRAIKSGEAILLHSVRQAQEVEKGDSVELRVRSGQLLLITQAIAETGGSVGGKVVVSNPNSKKKFLAMVIGPGKVETLKQGASD